jgi:hypothetical protein
VRAARRRLPERCVGEVARPWLEEAALQAKDFMRVDAMRFDHWLAFVFCAYEVS